MPEFEVESDPVADSLAETKGQDTDLRIAQAWMAWANLRVVPLLAAATALMVTMTTLLITNDQDAGELGLKFNSSHVEYQMDGGVRLSYRHPTVYGEATIDTIDIYIMDVVSGVMSKKITFETPGDAQAKYTVPPSATGQWLRGGVKIRAKIIYWLANVDGVLTPHTFWAANTYLVP